MIFDKRKAFRHILESSGGTHMSLYYSSFRDETSFKKLLKNDLEQMSCQLESIMTIQEIKNFLDPVNKLLLDLTVIRNIKGSIALFRNQKNFRIVSLPINVSHQTYLANTFHVKPLLKWIQHDREFLFLGFNTDEASLFIGNQSYTHKVDTLSGPFTLSKSKTSLLRKKGFENWLLTWIEEFRKTTDIDFYISADSHLTEHFIEKLSNAENIEYKLVSDSYKSESLGDYFLNIRKDLELKSLQDLEDSLVEFQIAEQNNLTKKNIFLIAKAAVQGRVKKLIVADEIQIFGKIDQNTGGLALHPYDLDHEDDDILDDLAQTVLKNGGEVVLAPKEEIPNKKMVLAILFNGLEKPHNNYDLIEKQYPLTRESI